MKTSQVAARLAAGIGVAALAVIATPLAASADTAVPAADVVFTPSTPTPIPLSLPAGEKSARTAHWTVSATSTGNFEFRGIVGSGANAWMTEGGTLTITATDGTVTEPLLSCTMPGGIGSNRECFSDEITINAGDELAYTFPFEALTAGDPGFGDKVIAPSISGTFTDAAGSSELPQQSFPYDVVEAISTDVTLVPVTPTDPIEAQRDVSLPMAGTWKVQAKPSTTGMAFGRFELNFAVSGAGAVDDSATHAITLTSDGTTLDLPVDCRTASANPRILTCKTVDQIWIKDGDTVTFSSAMMPGHLGSADGATITPAMYGSFYGNDGKVAAAGHLIWSGTLLPVPAVDPVVGGISAAAVLGLAGVGFVLVRRRRAAAVNG